MLDVHILINIYHATQLELERAIVAGRQSDARRHLDKLFELQDLIDNNPTNVTVNL